jgi:hypothetical protein
MSRFSRAIVVIAVVAFLPAACSSSSKPKVDSNKPLTKAEYIKRADAICRSHNSRISSVVNRAGSDLTLAEAKATWNEKLIPLFREEFTELRSLRAPKADATLLDQATLALSSGINTVAGLVGSAKSKADLDAMKPTGFGRWAQAATAYGMHDCAGKK